MKTRLLLLSVLLFAPFVSAAESTPEVVAQTKEVAPTKLKVATDDFLIYAMDRAKSYTGKLEDGVAMAVDTVREQSPLVVAEFLRWRAWKHGICGFVAPAILLLWLPFIIWGLSTGSDHHNTVRFFLGGVAGCFYALVLLMTGPLWASNIMSFIQIQVAPRIYLIEQVAALVK